jgi:hypothetical protein
LTPSPHWAITQLVENIKVRVPSRAVFIFIEVSPCSLVVFLADALGTSYITVIAAVGKLHPVEAPARATVRVGTDRESHFITHLKKSPG